MNDIRFKNLDDLYKRIYPALSSKKRELKKKKINYIKEQDIWDYLKKFRWNTAKDLDLGEMVNDIFNVTEEELDKYVRLEFSKRNVG